MTEHLYQWHYVQAAYVIGVTGTTALVAWVLYAMRRSEKRRDRIKGK